MKNKKFRQTETAVKFLENKIELWKFSQLLQDVYKGEDLTQRLIDKLSEYCPEKEDVREQIARKVRNWMADRNRPVNREELFRICFALELNEGQADCILRGADENGIHYRNPRELVYSFCLRNGWDYFSARKLAEELVNCVDNRNREMLTGIIATVSIKNGFEKISTEKELREFFEEYRDIFATYHDTAYRKFEKMLGNLRRCQSGAADLPEETVYSVERAVAEYLRMDIPYDKKIKGYGRIQKEIKQHWPSPKSVGEMHRGKCDVNRKTLILLYLATEGLDEVEDDDPHFVEEHYKKINMMLSESGMALLDKHYPFDYLVIQSLYLEGEEDCISLKMRRMLKKLFGTGDEIVYIKEMGNG